MRFLASFVSRNLFCSANIEKKYVTKKLPSLFLLFFNNIWVSKKQKRKSLSISSRLTHYLLVKSIDLLRVFIEVSVERKCRHLLLFEIFHHLRVDTITTHHDAIREIDRQLHQVVIIHDAPIFYFLYFRITDSIETQFIRGTQVEGFFHILVIERVYHFGILETGVVGVTFFDVKGGQCTKPSMAVYHVGNPT